jgi:hypothetical protein
MDRNGKQAYDLKENLLKRSGNNLVLNVSFHSMLDVGCSTFDVHKSTLQPDDPKKVFSVLVSVGFTYTRFPPLSEVKSAGCPATGFCRFKNLRTMRNSRKCQAYNDL